MLHRAGLAALLALAAAAAGPAAAQNEVAPIPALTGTRLDITATVEVSRVPDVVRITAGVSTRAPTAAAALRQNAERMTRVRAALTRAGIADRDVQTQSLSLTAVTRNLERADDGLDQDVVGYLASNDLVIRFREIGVPGASSMRW
ncbi:MAG TPA: SIMPL domain-containing protein [Allosphingosinicella sp.]|nr:SIMPL domain-containing protein [Allosphingosinicella sp.]